MQHLLFVYGTLLLADNDIVRQLRQHSCFVTHGTIRGALYDIGEYPGLIMNSPTVALVQGNVYEVDEVALKIVDDYEGFGPGQDEPFLYLREMKDIETDKVIVKAWVYIYDHDITGLTPIVSGNYIEYLAQKKSRDA
ncbi:gamma-glutamylcyclotransferase [Mucilaginibacter pallidiroseus]|uniref:Gamma-glutamylcyclotransferase n=1 Tax=Mucilaginibacter pallidiroseus TaxID=2599295 RepID=A0A563UJG2_9SPHI|nr:gamma-glutamylcyclotransferase family protein [Mucilaginibacter pallidiroseus]TWR31449.1 gamma-glutamylcyclotransferase [Mucilaginibacter pallidiroseus]